MGMDEIHRIIERYEKREKEGIDRQQAQFPVFRRFMKTEREKVYEQVIRKYMKNVADAKIIEVGAGDGSNLEFFKTVGFQPENIYANELIPRKAESLKTLLTDSFVHEGNALNLPFSDDFDICFQSTVFTSIFDDDLKRKLADKMLDMLKPGGIILWYDFTFNNPGNKDVKGITKREIKILFPGAADITFIRVTLAPPIGRRVGRLYPLINFLFPFLRSHVIAVIKKKKNGL
jgi:SAM-dependent methyltransferase